MSESSSRHVVKLDSSASVLEVCCIEASFLTICLRPLPQCQYIQDLHVPSFQGLKAAHGMPRSTGTVEEGGRHCFLEPLLEGRGDA